MRQPFFAVREGSLSGARALFCGARGGICGATAIFRFTLTVIIIGKGYITVSLGVVLHMRGELFPILGIVLQAGASDAPRATPPGLSGPVFPAPICQFFEKKEKKCCGAKRLPYNPVQVDKIKF